jgi:2-dehydro-3-deoxy-D-arabinonate dehydratase
MKLYRVNEGIRIEDEGRNYAMPVTDWDRFINDDDLFTILKSAIENGEAKAAAAVAENEILSPLNQQELWACGVTYLRSKQGRQEESKSSGGADFYGKVYEAERPEVFFKSTAHRVVGHKGMVSIRKDSTWDVPEPELTLVVTSSGKIIGYTIGNDMSSRSIEGENPLYLPQAKTYDGCAAIGPCIFINERPIDKNAMIRLVIKRQQEVVFEGSVSISQMKRGHEELVSFVYRECSFPSGCFVMTGTGIVPGSDFTLKSGDEISITIDHIGTLINTVR